jgi:RNA polymerase sigma-70 factor (family 1)
MDETAGVIAELQKRISLYEDMKAYKQLYELFFPKLFRFSHSFVKSKEAAEEIVSDVFIKIWEIKGSLATILDLNVYLYTITKNFSLNYITKNHKLRTINLDDINDESFLNQVTPEDSFISSEIINMVNTAINGLPPQCRIIFFLVKESGLKYKAVAEVLNISVHTVRNQMAIATKKIADHLPFSVKAQFLPVPKFSEC